MTDNFVLDTSNMDNIIQDIQKLGKTMNDIKSDLKHDVVRYSKDWQGKGRTMFERKYMLIIRQLDDLGEDVYDIAEELLKASEAYIQADTDAAKVRPGKDNGSMGGR